MPTLSDGPHDLATGILTLEVTALVADAGVPVPSVYQLRRPSRSEDIAHLLCEH